MSAQLGGGITLDYGPQGAQQPGGALLLDFFIAPTMQRIGRSTRAPWGGSVRTEMDLRAVQEAAIAEQTGVHARWGVGHGEDAPQLVPWIISHRLDDHAAAPWGRYTSRAEPESRSVWIISRTADDHAAAPWGHYTGRAEPESRSLWIVSKASDKRAGFPWGGPSLAADRDRSLAFLAALPSDVVRVAPWGNYERVIQPGVGISIPPDDGIPEPLVVVPLRSVYVQVNATSLRRVSDGLPLPALSISMSLDADSWVWSFNASLPASELPNVEGVEGEPVELEASINGESFRLLVERITRERTFGKAAIQISGRGKLALLDAPYAPVMNFGNTDPRTVQQLMNDVLTLNGVSLGWLVNFEPEDWLVPANVFSHRGTYISALNDIAAAAGAYVQPHASGNELFIRSRYPVAPWKWATDVYPDFELPSAPVTRESIEWIDKPRYNRVYVSGIGAGVQGRVTRAGTAGDLLAPAVTHALITAAAGARQRGIVELAQTGRMANTTLRLPVLDETGIITPGKFVKYVDGTSTRIGIVRAVSVEVGMPQVWQSIQLETHVEPV